MVVIDEEQYLAHYGILRRSGRYPWGSGGNQSTRNRTFLETISGLKQQGLSDVEIAKGFDISTTQLRAAKSIAKAEQKQSQIMMAQRLKDKGNSNGAIASRMGLPGESSVRALLADGAKDKSDLLVATTEVLKSEVEKHKYIDVGSGVENHLGVSKERLGVAVAMLREQGYELHPVKIPQVGTGLDTEMKVLCPPGTKQREVFDNRFNVKVPFQFSEDGGRTFGKIHPPISIHPSRVDVKYKEDGGDKADGVIYVRPGVSDLSLGNSRYSQVRILVGDGHYLKGMAMYKDDLPEGTDLLFNTNKSATGNKLDAMKKISSDPNLPFESVVRQITADTGTPHERVVSAMNLVNEEGQWNKWNRNLSSQFLSKQSPVLAKSQLDMTFERRKKEFDEIMSLTNPTVKKKLLDDFADGADSASVHLKSAALPRSDWHVILPIESMKPTEIYAPRYNNGEQVVLIRYPHGGTFEIPELTVNNKQSEAKRLLGDTPDAIGIHHTVAEHLSGADFDGDTVLVIPNNNRKIRTSPALEGLKNFDPQSYKLSDDSPIPRISPSRKQQEMGNISNLITDMTIKGAPHVKLARAVRHSMVVIDSEKHHLNYKQSAIDNGIPQLKAEYQGTSRAGAATLVSRKKSVVVVPDRKERPQSQGGPIDKATGRRVFVETGKTRTNKLGEVVPKTIKVNKLAEATDAHSLVSSTNTRIEKIYADHSNKLKDLANTARLASINTPTIKYSSSAKKIYASEVAALDSKLALVQRNRPLERQAQVIANARVRALREANPNLGADTIKKLKFQAQEDARARVGKKADKIEITSKEWDAIQAGAISPSKLEQILAKANMETVRELATPKTKLLMTPTKTARAKQMLSSGYTRAEVAKQLGVSLTTLDTATVGNN